MRHGFRALTATGKSDVVRSQHENFEVHDFSEPTLQVRVDALEDDDWGCLDGHGNVCPFVKSEVVGWDLAVFA